jgi:hypothetical protein
MNTSNDLLDPCYQELNKIRFVQRMNHYNRMIKWLVVVNIVAWLAVVYILPKCFSI